MKTGQVILVGAGPGDPGLLTIKGRHAIETAEVVVYDRLVSREILDLIPEQAERINVGKEAAHHMVPQEQINRILLEKALSGKRVVRLKGGDPFLFGRGGEELELLAQHGVPFQEIPGITSTSNPPSLLNTSRSPLAPLKKPVSPDRATAAVSYSGWSFKKPRILSG